MGMSNIDPTESKIQLEVLKERIKYSDEKFFQQEQILVQAYKDLGQKEAELKQIRDQHHDLRIKWEVLQRDFKHAQDSIAKAAQKTSKKENSARFQAFNISLIFLLSTILVNIGTSLLTSSPPNSSLGWLMIALAAAAYILGALMTWRWKEETYD